LEGRLEVKMQKYFETRVHAIVRLEVTKDFVASEVAIINREMVRFGNVTILSRYHLKMDQIKHNSVDGNIIENQTCSEMHTLVVA
jgi:hypothetical protein